MTRIMKQHGGLMLAGGFLAGMAAFMIMAFTADPGPTREIVLVARDVAFVSPDRPALPNPPLTLKKGEPVRLTIRNGEPDRVLHCLTIGGMNVKTPGSLAAGESVTLTFTPKQKGTFTYACLMHPTMIGRISVE